MSSLRSYHIGELLGIKSKQLKAFVVKAATPQEAKPKAESIVQNHFPELWEKHIGNLKPVTSNDLFGGAHGNE